MSFAEGTTVPVAKTRVEIETLVARYGASRWANGWMDDNRAAVSFALKGRLVRFVLQLPTDEEAQKRTKRRGSWRPATNAQVTQWKEGESRRRWRCLLLAIKAKLEVVESGIATFEEEFLAHIVVDGKFTVYERIKLMEESGQRMLPPMDGDGA